MRLIPEARNPVLCERDPCVEGQRASADCSGDDEVETKRSIVRALIGMVEIWMDPSYDLWYVGMRLLARANRKHNATDANNSDNSAAEKTCEDLLHLALQTDPGNTEAMQTLASVRMSQQRPDDAKVCLEQAWSQWKDLDLGEAR